MEPPSDPPNNWNFQREAQSMGPLEFLLDSTDRLETGEIEDNDDSLANPPPERPVLRTGTATQGAVAQPIGQVDVGESTSAYLFRVAIPGVAKRSVKCEIENSGKVTVHGATRTAEIVCGSRHVFFMWSESLPPRGDFTVSFNLPGPVNNRTCACTINLGLLEGVVCKADNLASPGTINNSTRTIVFDEAFLV